VLIFQSSWRHILEECGLVVHQCENFISVIGFKKCSFLMWHILEAVTAVDSDILCNILKLLTARQMDI